VELKTKDCPQGRLCHSGVVHDDKMYVYGGHITQPSSEFFHDVKQDMYEYSFGTREWAIVPGTIAPKRTEHSAVVWKDSMIIFGGYSGVGYENSVFSYNYRTREWTLLDAKGEIPTARSAHTAVLYNDKNVRVRRLERTKLHERSVRVGLNNECLEKCENRRTYPLLSVLPWDNCF